MTAHLAVTGRHNVSPKLLKDQQCGRGTVVVAQWLERDDANSQYQLKDTNYGISLFTNSHIPHFYNYI